MKEDEDERPALEPHEKAYRLVVDWHTDCKGILSEKITIPKGFVTDSASIPRFLWSVCGNPMATPRIYAAIVHDWLYDAEHMLPDRTDNGSNILRPATREDADRIYRDYEIALGISKFKAYIEYYALRAFGWTHWYE